MGYTHYWRRAPVIDLNTFVNIRRDVTRTLPALDQRGIELAGPLGTGGPVFSFEEIAFNGRRHCGHLQRQLGIAWPARRARGVCVAASDKTRDALGGWWFAGRTLRARTCDGDCSHETFMLLRVRTPAVRELPNETEYFDCCKTAYKPYDLAVQVCLVIAAHHLGDAMQVSSDGSLDEWQDAIALCQEVLGYGRAFRLA
ncbi:MAG TPA: hypothetical protein PKJ99_09505 [Thermoanaerobaculales bacterium]|nr:hypothetical protein [Thermoanaerobaculales bacterium]